MSDKQTRCPKCSTIYKVTLTQLTVAQGMVCCPKCLTNFNALTHLTPVASAQTSDSPTHVFPPGQRNQISSEPGTDILSIFERKTENSNIDLLTYLNNLTAFRHGNILTLPALYLSEHEVRHSDLARKSSAQSRYLLWGSVNAGLMLMLLLLLAWFNPQFLHNSPFLSPAFHQVCKLFNCKTTEAQYALLSLQKVRLTRSGPHEVLFSGTLLNHYQSSLTLPNIQLTLSRQGQETFRTVLRPEQYLENNLSGIQRIPSNRPFKFEFRINQNRNSFDEYNVEIIHP